MSVLQKTRRTEYSIRLVLICFGLAYLAATAFERAVNRDLYRAAAFLCNAPFCTALSIVEIVTGKSSLIWFASPEPMAPRRFLIEVLTRLRLPRLIFRRASLWRILFSADL